MDFWQSVVMLIVTAPYICKHQNLMQQSKFVFIFASVLAFLKNAFRCNQIFKVQDDIALA
jgi:hypothetical protein